MARSQHEGLAQAPTFTLHRVNVTVADPSIGSLSLEEKYGFDGRLFSRILADVNIVDHTAPIFSVEMLVWSDLAQTFVQIEDGGPAIVSGLSGRRMLTFANRGMRFYLHIAGALGGGKVNISVAGAPPLPEERA